MVFSLKKNVIDEIKKGFKDTDSYFLLFFFLFRVIER